MKENTNLDHKERLNRVLIYIQEHIHDTLSLELLSAVACLSPFHFHRIFRALVGETVNDYVRRIRLERAALKLSYSREPVTAIAMASGYETPSAFTKAFVQHFGKSPSAFRGLKNLEMALSRDLLQLHNNNRQRGSTLKPDIRTLPAQKVLFVQGKGSYEAAAGEAWSVLMRYAFSHNLINEATKIIGIAHDDPQITGEENIRYDACITVDEDVKPQGEAGIQTIKGGLYAVFHHQGPYDKVSVLYDSIFGHWLPESGRRLRDIEGFEQYLDNPRNTKPESLRTEIFIPIE